MSRELYNLTHSPATLSSAATWNVYGDGFGLRCFSSKKEAVDEATLYFGVAKFEVYIWPDRSSLHVLAAPGADPGTILDQAIAALQAERAALANCPVHKARVDRV